MGGRHSHPRHKSPPLRLQQEQQQNHHHQPTLPSLRRFPDGENFHVSSAEYSAKRTSDGSVTSIGNENKGRPQRPKTLQPLSFNRSRVFSQHRRRPSNKNRCFPSLNKSVCYNSHTTQTSSWLPPIENWSPDRLGLPYGWETAVDKEGKTYFINHLNKTTSYDDPRTDFQEDPPSPRLIELTRDPDMGFGFVAGSEKPVIVRFVTDGGPSVDKLLPGDQILMINGENVKKAPRDHVIQLVRSCKENVTLTVCQPPLDNSARKSALLSAAKKQRLKHNPSRVRFAESVDINGATSLSPSQISSSESTTPFMPNVLKVFLENGQTKSFKYDISTTVGDVLDSLHQKLGIKCQEHFSLVVEHVKSLRRNKLTLLDRHDTLTKIAAQPGAQHLRCLYRITFVPRDAYDMLRKDSVGFEYLFLQCCNDVIQERFSPELKYDVALRLAALHIHQHALSSTSSSSNAKISLKTIERECGLDRFIPASLVESMKKKEIRKLLSHFLKLHGGLAAPGQKQMTALQAKLHYLRIISELPSYGAKCFSTNVMEANVESVLLISPRFGISQISGIRNSMPDPLCEIEQITSVSGVREDDISMRVHITLKHPDKENLVVSLDDRDAEELILVLQGYYKLLTEESLAVSYPKDSFSRDQVSTSAPPYHSCHLVQSSPWSYINAIEEEEHPEQKVADLTAAPPYQHLPEGYKIPNGNIPRITDSEMVNSFGNGGRMPLLDSNMNKTMSVYDNTGDSSLSHASFVSCIGGATEADKPFPERTGDRTLPQTHSPSEFSMEREVKHPSEAKNFEVITHALEVRQMVEDAETYLSDPEAEVTDAESIRSESYGKLKHSDSLLLLNQGQKLVAKVGALENEERSESDTDSQSTPLNSPAHKSFESSSPPLHPASIVKTSGSSFGLHSPDNLPIKFENPDTHIQTLLLRHLEDNSGLLPYTFAEGTLYLDPDIIDLTMIPPPITPDEEGAKMFPSQLSTPPTPFADRESLDQELQALERDVGDLRLLTNTSWLEGGTLQSLSESLNAGPSETDDTLSLSSVSTNTESMRRSSSLANLMKRNGSNGGPGFTLAALRQLGINIGEGEDIDSFIANLTIPPPPEGLAALLNYKDERKMGEYDINTYIIPPPPSNAASDNRSSDIIRRLYEAKEGISRVVGNFEVECIERDNDVDELNITSQHLPRDSIQAGRVASLQKHFENPFGPPTSYGNENAAPETKHKTTKFHKNKLNLVKELAGHNNLRTNNFRLPREMDVRLAEVLAENNKMLKSFNSPLKSLSSVSLGFENNGVQPPKDTLTSPLASRTRAYDHLSQSLGESNGVKSIRNETTCRQSLHLLQHPYREARNISSETEDILPTVSLQKDHRGTFQGSNTIEGETMPSFNNKKLETSEGTLSKSASHGNIAIQSQTSTKLLSSLIQPGKSSVSNEDLHTSNWPHDSEGKQSITSSNDSLTSTSSVATVKSVSIKSLDNDDPPELPPRNSAKVNLKPPLSRNPVQESRRGLSSVEGIRTPSPIRKLDQTLSPEVGGDKPPAVPCRTKKTSPPSNTLSQSGSATLRKNTGLKSTKPHEAIVNDQDQGSRNATLPRKFTCNNEYVKPALPFKTSQPQAKKHLSSVSQISPKLIHSTLRQSHLNNGVSIKNSYNQDQPLHTSSPKLPPKIKMVNGKSVGGDLNDSLDSGSFDQDSLEETEHIEVMLPASREAYRHAVSIVNESLKKLTDMIGTCSKYQEEGDNTSKDEDSFQRAKECLASESRQFVTASKLFVKSTTESEEVLLNSLSKCITILEKMVDVSQLVVKVTSTPSQTQTVVLKVRDVTNAYLWTIKAALSASGRGIDHPSMNTLMGQATSLAGVLTALMRTLKVFSP